MYKAIGPASGRTRDVKIDISIESVLENEFARCPNI